jgi:VWFA-related protein
LAFRKASIAAAAVWLAAFASGLAAMAQEANGPAIDVASVDTSRFPTVSAVVNVLDAKGRPIAGLSASTFSATVDGQPATIEGLQPVVDSQVSLSVVLAVDASGSMAGAPLTAAQAAAAEFVNGLAPQDSVAVLAFADAVTVAQEPTSDKAAAIGALQNLTSAGDTALFEATSRATAKALESTSPRRVIILLSDGVDYGRKSTVTRDDSIATARAAGVPVYTIALGADVDKAYLSELAQATGARFLEAPSPESLSQLYADIGAVLRGQYIVTLQSPAVDGGAASHALGLSVTVEGAMAVASRSFDAIPSGESPAVAIGGLSAGDSLKSPVTVTAQVSGGAPTEVRFLIDGTLVTTATAAPYQATVDPAALSGGDHTLRVEARDANGVLAASEAAFSSSAAAGGAMGKAPIFAVLIVVTLAAGGAYALQRRRPRVKRQVVEVRLKPWSNNGTAAGGMSLLDGETLTPSAPEPVEEPGGKLVIVDGPDSGKEVFVGMNPVSIGAAPWCDISLPDEDGSIGQEEARAWVHQDKLIFHRLTRLSLLASDGAVGGWLILENGDEVNVGAFRLRFVSLTPVIAEQDNVNKALHEAVQHFSARPSDVGLASRLWPTEDPPRKPAPEKEESPQPVSSELAASAEAPAEALEPQETGAEEGSSRFWPAGSQPVESLRAQEAEAEAGLEPEPVDEPRAAALESQSVAPEAGSSRFWPADSGPLGLIRREEPDVQSTPSEPEPSGEPPAEAAEPEPLRAEADHLRLWPVDEPPPELCGPEDVIDDREPVDLWPVDDLPADREPLDEDLDPPAAASSA